MTSRVIIVAVMAGLAAWETMPGAPAAAPAIELPVCDQPPMLDGALDDPAWQTAAQIARLYPPGAETPDNQTVVSLIRDMSWLYVGVKCVNSNMRHVTQTVFKHDGLAYQDDSVELFVRPEPGDQRYYQFKLSFANVAAEQRTSAAGARDDGWSPPWRTITQRLPDGWTAEVAIPWFVFESADLSGLQINFIRNCMRIELDPYGAKQSETLEYRFLKPASAGSAHKFDNFIPIQGLAGFQPEIPFAPRIVSAAVTGLIWEDRRYYYGVQAALDLASPVPGAVRVSVAEEVTGDGTAEKYSELVELAGRRELEFKMPAGDFRDRRIEVRLADPQHGNLLGTMAIEDTSALKVIRRAFTGRSYYTSEAQADLLVELGLPAETLQKAVLAIEINETPAAEIVGLRAEMRPGVPLSALRLGVNRAMLRLKLDGRELASQELEIVRLEPRPEHEVKADYIRGTLLHAGQPVFPLGIYAHSLGMGVRHRGIQDGEEGVFKFISEIGFNTVLRLSQYQDEDRFMRLADKYGLKVITWSMPDPLYLAGTNLFTSYDRWRSFQQANKIPDLPLPEKLAIQRKWYAALEPEFIRETKSLRGHKNLLGYYNVDEPNLHNPDERIAVAEWYWETVKAIDPYRPLYLLYSSNVPHGDNWTRWGETLGFDIYPRPFLPGIFGEPGLYTAYYAHELRERCRQDRKIMFFVPLSNTLDPYRTPIGMSREHMLCQAYVATIYGARGLLYFALNNVVGEHAWDALREICAQFKALTPALVNGEIAQTIKYIPDDFRPRERKFPAVNAALYQYPDGGYLLLAANIMPHAVDAAFQVGGIKHAARMFGDDKHSEFSHQDTKIQRKLELEEEVFNDKIEPYGTRAYRIQLGAEAADAARSVDISVTMTPAPDEVAPAVDIQGIVRRVTLGKNHVPNPCFKQRFNKGIPDFYRPYFNLSIDPDAGKKGSTWYVDDEVLWEGNPSLRMFKRPIQDPGYQGPGNKTRGTFGVCHAPISGQPRVMTFSLYARAQAPEGGLWIRIGGKEITFKNLGTNWARHSLSFEWAGGAASFLMIPVENTRVWISGLQVEEGETPTAFQDDSAGGPVEKKKISEEPGELIRNGGAEYGSAEGWTGLETEKEIGVRRGIGRRGEYCFLWRRQSATIQSDWIAVDTNQAYELSGWFMSETGMPVKLLFGAVLSDQEQRPLHTRNFLSVPGSRTELAADCGAGDQILNLRDASAWQTGRNFVAAFGKNEKELNFDLTPPGVMNVHAEDGHWKIALREPCGIALPAGTPVVENRVSSGGIFVAGNEPVSNAWRELKGVIGPRQWWPGARYVKIYIQPQLAGPAGALRMDDISFKIQGEQ